MVSSYAWETWGARNDGASPGRISILLCVEAGCDSRGGGGGRDGPRESAGRVGSLVGGRDADGGDHLIAGGLEGDSEACPVRVRAGTDSVASTTPMRSTR